MTLARQREWAEAQRRCRLTDEALAMAKELGLSPPSLIKNIPNRAEPWKAPVEDWVRRLHLKKFGRRPTCPAPPRAAVEAPPPPPAVSPSDEPLFPAPHFPPDPTPPEPAPPDVNELVTAEDEVMRQMMAGELDSEEALGKMERLDRELPVSAGEISDQNRWLLLRRDCFRRFAEMFAAAAGRLDFVQRVVLFGSVAAPLQKEVPRFRRLRRAHAEVWHECKDVDLAVWVSDLTRLRELKRAVSDTANAWQAIAHEENLPGIPHHQVDVFIMEPVTHRYRGNLCHYGQCPKGKPECEITGCGAQPFLRLYDDFKFDRWAPLRAPAVVLFDRAVPAGPA